MNFKEFIEGMDASMVGDLSQTFSNSDGDFEKNGVSSKYFTKNSVADKSNFNPEKIYGKKISKLYRRKRNK
jgi:hypothetical protein